MGWTMANYHRSIRLAQMDKYNIGIIGSILQFMWHFCVTGMLENSSNHPFPTDNKFLQFQEFYL